MPNWVFNRIVFNTDTAERVKTLVELKDLVMSENSPFDFNRIVPMPESLKICAGSVTDDAEDLLAGRELRIEYPDMGEEPSPEYFYDYKSPETLPELRVFARIVQSNKEKYGCADWYTWCRKNWGCKWGAASAYWESTNEVTFDTPWCSPEPIFLKLSEMFDIPFTVYCEEESLAFCSVTEYEDGMVVYEACEDGVEGLKLLGYPKDEVIDRYSWDEDMLNDMMPEINRIYGEEE